MKMYLFITLLCAAIAPGCFSDEDIHKYMSPDEVQRVFHADADSVPEYEVVQLHVRERLHRRDVSAGRHIHTKAFGEDINLWMHPTDSILAGRHTPIYYAKQSSSKPQGVEYRRQYGLMKGIGDIFEDPVAMASMVIGTENNGRTRINGFIESKGIAIRPLPTRVADEYSRRRRSIDGLEDPKYSPYHVVIRMNETLKEHYSHSAVNTTRLRERLARSVEAVPDTLYPEVLVVVENSVYTAYDTPQGYDIYSLLEYLLASWNGIDLKYRSIDSPKFRFHIAAIVLAEDAGATPYIYKNMVSRKAFDTYKAMPAAKNFWYGVKDTFPLDSYDIAATMTKRDLSLTRNILGQAWIGAACQRNDIYGTIDAVTICKDDGVFSGIHTLAHEMGHIFGADHDYSEECTYHYGFLMSPVPWFTTNTSDFSPCSMKAIQKRLNDQKLTCLYNRPEEDGENLPKIMPGKLKNLDDQCKSLAGGASCQDEHPEHSICVNLFCIDKEGKCTETGTSALDGTRCGSTNHFCLHQRCVSL